jgi:threonine/homoserine/homoserine lactone efflux protein
MSPGPSFVLVAHTAMAKSRSEAIGVAIGMGVGVTVFAIIASAGVFILLEMVPWLYGLLKIIGGSYLCFLAFKMWNSSKEPMTQSTTNEKTESGVFKMFFVGLFTQLTNPKTAIVFAGVFAAFLPKEVPEYSYYLISSSAFVIDTLWYTLVATVLSTQKAQNTYAKFKNHIGRVTSGFIGLMGIKLLIDQ